MLVHLTVSDNLRQRHMRVRAGLISQGTSLSAWCKAHGVKHQNANKALLQTWTGPKASALVDRILAAAQVTD
jgi:hypothetical protein